MALTIITPARKQLSSKVRAALWMWAYIGFLSLITILPTPLVTALKPIPVYGPAYDTINEDLFIIQGGGVYQNATFTANVSQFIALDLTRPSWDVSDPPWVPVNVTSVIPLPPPSSDLLSLNDNLLGPSDCHDLGLGLPWICHQLHSLHGSLVDL